MIRELTLRAPTDWTLSCDNCLLSTTKNRVCVRRVFDN